MPTALLPNGQTKYVDHYLDLSVSFADRSINKSMEQTLREGLAGEQRQLFVRVQGGGGFGPWCFWLQWGNGENCRRTEPICLKEEEHTPQAVLNRIQAELAKWGPREVV